MFASGSVTSVGSMVTAVTLPFQVARLTGSPVLVGLLGVCELAPLLFMAFVGGALADYLDRRRLILVGEVAFAALSAVLLLNTMVGQPRLWVLFVIAGLTAAVDGVQRPALDAVLPRLVTPEQVPAANALNSLRTTVAMLAGPALAGVLIASAGLGWVYAIDLGTFAVSLGFLLLLKPVPPPPAPERPSLRSVATGVRYALRRPELLGTYLVDINAMFFGMPQALYPFVADKLGGPAVLGLLYAAPSAGAALATVTSGWTSRVRRDGVAVLVAAAGWGVGIIGFGLSRSLWFALLGLVVAGFADMVSGLFRSIIWNQTVPDHLRGRLAGIEMLSYSSGPTLGNLESGVMTRFVGISGSIVWGGVLCVAGTAALALALPAFRRYDGRDGRQHKQDADRLWAETAHERLLAPVESSSAQSETVSDVAGSA